jgi:Uma2 family endonuclease
MSTSTRVTLAQYHEMIRQGLFEPREEHHVELLYGEIVPMSPIGPPHDNTITELTEWSYESLPPKAVRIVVQGAVTIFEFESEPEPDLVWARRANYAERHPEPADVLLVVEVSDSSLSKDRNLKARLYAESGIADYWIVNLKDRCVEVRRDPHGPAYRSVEVFRAGQEVRPLAFPDVALPVDRVFPG